MKDRATNDVLTSLTRKTHGFSYKQLSDLVSILSLEKNLTDAFIDEAVTSQSFSETTESVLRRTYESAAKFFSEQKSGISYVSKSENTNSVSSTNKLSNNTSSQSDNNTASGKEFYTNSQIAESKKQYRKELEKELPYKVMDNLLLDYSWDQIALEHS